MDCANAQVRFEARPRLAEVLGAISDKLGGRNSKAEFDFGYHTAPVPPAKKGENRCVRDDEAFEECLEYVRSNGMAPLAIEIYPRTGLVHLDLYDADAEDDDVYLGQVTVPDTASWRDVEAALRAEFGELMRDGCLVYWVRQGRGTGGEVAVVGSKGEGWEALRSSCLRNAGSRAEVDIKVIAICELECACAEGGRGRGSDRKRVVDFFGGGRERGGSSSLHLMHCWRFPFRGHCSA